jgi:hypothetical protein
MRPPFPGMDPWIEHPAIWPDVHNSLITAIRDELAPRLAPKYSVGVEQRVYLLVPGEPKFVDRPDVAVVGRSDRAGYREPAGQEEAASVGVIDVEVPVLDELEEWFLEVRDVETRSLVTAIEILSPTNKIDPKGRKKYMRKRRTLLESESSLVEIDLLRAGEPMPMNRDRSHTDYRILVSREATRPRAKLFIFNVPQPIPPIPIPLLPGDVEPELELGAILPALYDRARFDLRLDYAKPPVPPLTEGNAEWARAIVGGMPPR